MRRLIAVLLVVSPLFGGDLTARFDLTVNRVLRGAPPRLNDDFILADLIPAPTRRFTDYSGDLSGRYIEALSAASRQSGIAYADLDRLVLKALALQKPDGHFGAPVATGPVTGADMAMLWGNGRMLVGLLEYYGLTHLPAALSAARKLGDFLVAQAPRLNAEQVRSEFNGRHFAAGYICWTQNVEGLAALYRATREARYLALARDIATRVDRHPAQHSHGFLTSVRGVLDLYRITSEPRYLNQARAAWQDVLSSGNVFVSGGVPEMFAPENKRDEGCSEADWLRLTLELWQITHEAEYLQQAQRSWFNEFSFNQFHTGDFGHHELSPRGTSPPAARAWWCCTFHGLRALAAIYGFVFHTEGAEVFYDLPLDGKVEAQGFQAAALSTLEMDASARLAILRSNGRVRQLNIRVPDWASNVAVTMRGLRVDTEMHGQYASVARAWQAGETIQITYVLRTRYEPRPQQPGQVAVFHGPWLLAVDEAQSPNFFDEPSNDNRVELSAEPQLDPAPPSAPKRFVVSVAHFEVKYLPGGYPMQPATALLRPIAEFTSGPDSNRLDFWFSRAGATR